MLGWPGTPEIATVRPPRNGPIMRQWSSWYRSGSYCSAESAKGKNNKQSAASNIQIRVPIPKKRIVTIFPRREVRINHGSGDWTGWSDAGSAVRHSESGQNALLNTGVESHPCKKRARMGHQALFLSVRNAEAGRGDEELALVAVHWVEVE